MQRPGKQQRRRLKYMRGAEARVLEAGASAFRGVVGNFLGEVGMGGWQGVANGYVDGEAGENGGSDAAYFGGQKYKKGA